MQDKTENKLAVAGHSITRTDDPDKVTGKLMYGADYLQDGFLQGKILRSPHPHAIIKSIDIEKAKELQGVVAVLTAKDVPGRNGFGAILPDQPVICGDKVRYVGDGVALVAAETEEIAHEALSLIRVEYEVLPAVFDPRDALKTDAPKVHESGNLLQKNKLRKGNVEKALRKRISSWKEPIRSLSWNMHILSRMSRLRLHSETAPCWWKAPCRPPLRYAEILPQSSAFR